MFAAERFCMSGKPVPARVETALALLESLRSDPSLALKPRLAEGGQSLRSHESLGAAALRRVGLDPLTKKTFGRRSNYIQKWGQDFLDLIRDSGFSTLADVDREAFISTLQGIVADLHRSLVNQSPIRVRLKGRSAKAVVADVLSAAEGRGSAAAVAQYLVGAKLLLRFPHRGDQIKVVGANLGDRRSFADPVGRRGDFDLGETVIEVTVGPPDSKHLAQAESVLKDPDARFWLLVREERLAFWRDESARYGLNLDRLVVSSIELFVGQNVAELGDLKPMGESEQLRKLFEIYNHQWVARVGSIGMSVELT